MMATMATAPMTNGSQFRSITSGLLVSLADEASGMLGPSAGRHGGRVPRIQVCASAGHTILPLFASWPSIAPMPNRLSFGLALIAALRG